MCMTSIQYKNPQSYLNATRWVKISKQSGGDNGDFVTNKHLCFYLYRFIIIIIIVIIFVRQDKQIRVALDVNGIRRRMAEMPCKGIGERFPSITR